MRRLLLVPLLLACDDGLARCPTDREQAAIHAAAYAWWSAGLPVDGCDLSELHVEWTRTDEQFRRRCVVSGKAAAACYLRDTVDGIYRQPLIVIAPGIELDESGMPLTHETAHYLDDCSGRPTDYEHADVLVWGPLGVVDEAGQFMRALGR